jgi:hypothetical protein
MRIRLLKNVLGVNCSSENFEAVFIRSGVHKSRIFRPVVNCTSENDSSNSEFFQNPLERIPGTTDRRGAPEKKPHFCPACSWRLFCFSSKSNFSLINPDR